MWELLGLMLQLFVFLVQLSIDVVCLGMGAIAFCSVFRTVTLVQQLSSASSRNDFRAACAANFFIIFLDVPCFLMFCGALAVPWRIIPCFVSMYDAFQRGAERDFNFNIRYVAFCQIFLSLFDIPCFIAGTAAMMLPWRFFKCLMDYWDQSSGSKGDGELQYNADLRFAALVQIWLTFTDILTLIPAAFCCSAPWRLHIIVRKSYEIDQKDGNQKRRWNGSIRSNILVNSFLSVFDFLTLFPLGIIVATVIRIYPLFKSLQEKWETEYEEKYDYYMYRRVVIWEQFFYLMLDVITLPLTVIVLLSWRSPLVFKVFADDSMSQVEKKFTIIKHFFGLISDLPVFVMFVFLFFSWRCPMAIAVVSEKSKGISKLKWAILEQFFQLLMDIPFVLIFVFLVCTLWRVPSLYRTLSENFSEKKFRKTVISELVAFFYNLPFFLLFIILVATVYRFFGMISQFIRLSKQPIFSSEKKMRVDEFRLEKVEQGGVKLHIAGTKTPNFTFTSAKLYIIGDSIWDTLNKIYSSMAISVARNMLPIELVPTSLKPEDIIAEADTFALELRFGIGNTMASEENVRSLLANLSRLDRSLNFHLHVEYGAQEGVLFDLLLKPNELATSLDSQSMQRVTIIGDFRENTTPMNYDEIFVSVVLSEFLLLGRDFLCIFGILRLMLLSPWNLIPLTTKLFESEEHATKRQLKEQMNLFKALDSHMINVQHMKDDYLETSLGTRARHEIGHSMETLTDPDDAHFEEKQERKAEIFKKISALDHGDLYVSMQRYYSLDSILDRQRVALFDFYRREHFAHLPLSVANKTAQGQKLEADLDSLKKEWATLHAQLVNTKIDVPNFFRGASWNNRSWSDKTVIIFGVLKKSTMDAIAGFCTLLVVLTVFRIIPLVISIKKRGADWHKACFRQLKELLVDFILLLKFIVVLVLIRHSVALIAECLSAIYVERSIKVVRQRIDTRYRQTGEDIFYLLSFITIGKTYLYILAISVWGLLGPADSIAQMMRDVGFDSCTRKNFSVMFWLFLIIFPFIMIFQYDMSDGADEASKLIAIYLGILFLIGIITVAYSMRVGKSLDKVQNSVEIHWNAANTGAIFQLLVEIYQNTSFVLSSNSDDEEVKKSSSFAFLTFDGDEAWQIPFWINFALFAFWFFLSSAPVVIEELLKFRDRGYFAENGLWNACMLHLSTTFMLTIIVNFMKVLDCVEVNDVLVLNDYPDIQCYTSDSGHRTVALLALLGLAYYTTTACMAGVQYMMEISKNKEKQSQIDIVFTVFYSTMIIIYKLLVSSIQVFSNDKNRDLVLYIALNLFMVLFGLGYKRFTGSYMTTILTAGGLRTGGFIMATYTAIVSLVIDSAEDSTTYWTVLVVGWGIILILSGTYGFILSVSRDRSAGFARVPRAELKKLLVSFKSLAESVPDDAMLFSWAENKKAWIRKLSTFQKPPHPLCQRCNRLSGLAAHLVEFEQNVKWHCLKPDFFRILPNWTARTNSAANLVHLAQALQILSNGIANSNPIQAPALNSNMDYESLTNQLEVEHASPYETYQGQSQDIDSSAILLSVEPELSVSSMSMDQIISKLIEHGIPQSVVSTILEYNIPKTELLSMTLESCNGLFGSEGQRLYEVLHTRLN